MATVDAQNSAIARAAPAMGEDLRCCRTGLGKAPAEKFVTVHTNK